MIGKLISMAGMMGMSLLCILFGHKWRRKMATRRIEHGCTNCGGTGAIPYYPDESAAPAYKACEECNGTGENPDNPVPQPPEGLSRRERKQWQRDHRPEKADWIRGKRTQKVVWPNCIRCGKANPNWREPENMRPDGDDGILWRLVKWLCGRLTGK